MRQITGLSAAIIPHRTWAARQWFHATGSRYYHRARLGKGLSPLKAPIYDEIDPDLRELCRFLHAMGLGTTPSCQGHFHDRNYFEERWALLKQEEAVIRSSGLSVSDSETLDSYLFCDPGYGLPWPTTELFYQESATHQKTGYLGVVIPEGQAALCDDLAKLALGLQQVWVSWSRPEVLDADAYLLEIIVRPESALHASALWNHIREEIRLIREIWTGRK